MSWKREATDPQFFVDADIALVKERFEYFCANFEKGIDSTHSPLEYQIPSLLHFIWLGSDLPPKAQESIASWKRIHPHWEVLIWTDREVEQFPWSAVHSQFAFAQAESWAEKSDILRYEILYQFGGVYSDTDVLCYHSLNDLIFSSLVFFAGLELNEVLKFHGKPLYLGTAVMGAVKGSSIMQYCIDHFQTEEEAPDSHLVIRSGPGLLSKACHEKLTQENILILPCSYFYPFPYKEKKENHQEYLHPSSLSVHLWEGSWIK